MATRRDFLVCTLVGVPLLASGCTQHNDTAALSYAPTASVRTGVMTGQTLSSLNALRASRGLRPMVADPVLSRAALEHARAMARSGRMSHAGFRRRMSRINAGAAAENVAFGQTSVSSVMQGWATSPGHLKNMLGAYSRVGVAVATNPASGNRPYWAMVVSR